MSGGRSRRSRSSATWPVIGNLFRSKTKARAKTNLMVFIRPTILRSAADARAMTERRYGYIRQARPPSNRDQEPSIDELVREYMGMVPPNPPPAPPPRVDMPVYAPAAQPGDQVIAPPPAPATSGETPQ
jgi:general secretion pathway protein D